MRAGLEPIFSWHIRFLSSVFKRKGHYGHEGKSPENGRDGSSFVYFVAFVFGVLA